ncbi:MAG: divergent polysaccharide deacetylase family protein [bacterium]
MASIAVAAIGVAAGLWAAAQPAVRLRAGPTVDASIRATPVPAPTPRSGPPGSGRQPGAAVPSPVPPTGVARPTLPPKGVVALIFDDAGATLAQLDPILALGRPATVAILPGLPASAAVAQRAGTSGLEVILHLPLEAEEANHALGPGGVTTAMSPDAIAAQVRAGLDGLPGVVGLSGHMGSRATADRRVMTAVLGVVRERGLFFVDSRTTLDSVAAAVARELGIAVAERAVFLDNEDDPAYIAGQVRRLLEVARAKGSAVGIGHVQKQTAEVVRSLLPEFDRARIVLVPVSVLVR